MADIEVTPSGRDDYDYWDCWIYAAGIEVSVEDKDDDYYHSTSTYKNCINTGKIISNAYDDDIDATTSAGICTYLNSKMTSCYNLSSDITASADYKRIGGLAAEAGDSAYMTNCATVTETDIGEASSNCLAQANTNVAASKFKSASGFKGLNFTKTWTFKSGVNSGFPVLKIYTNNSRAFALAAPKNVTAAKSVTSLTVSWDAVSGARSYRVAYSTDNKTWKYKNVATTKATITGLQPNTKYYYKVAPVARVLGTYSSSKAITTDVKLAAPAGIKATKTSNSITVSWSAVSGAVKYKVGYSTDNKTWTYKNTTNTKFTLTGLKANTKYYYKVLAINTGNGTWSKTLNVTTASGFTGAAPSSTAVTYSATYSWKAVDGADKYVVRYSLDNKKTWKTATVSKTSYTVKLAKGSTCYIQVAGISGNTVGKYTAIRTLSI